MTAADDLNRAADLLERDGWRQKALGPGPDAQGRRCIYGALNAACDESMDRFRAGRLFLTKVLPGGEKFALPAAWNDEPGRTVDEVIAACRAAAEVAGPSSQGEGAAAGIPSSLHPGAAGRSYDIVVEPLTRRQRLFNAADPGCERCGGMGTTLRRDGSMSDRLIACPCTEGDAA